MPESHERDHARNAEQAAAEPDPTHAAGRQTRTEGLAGPVVHRMSGLLLRKAARDAGLADDAEHAVGRAASSAGGGLPDSLRQRFESSLGTDLASVRVHTGSESASAAAAVNARAYAVGDDIHFGAGQYDPHSATGQHLIAHEVAHTVQQRGGSPTRQHKLAVSSAGDHAEVEADRAADAMLAGAPARIGGVGGGVLHRAEGEGFGAGGSQKISNKSIEATAYATVTKKLAVKACEIELVGKAAFTGKIEWPPPAGLPNVDGGKDSSGNGDGKKTGRDVTVEAPPLEIYKALEADLAKEGEDHAAQGWDVESVELVPSVKVGRETEQGKETKHGVGASLAATVEIKFKNGKKASVVGTLFGVKKESGQKPTFVGPSVTLLSPEATWQLFDRDLGHGCKATGAATLTASATIKLSAEAVTKEAIKKLEQQLLEKGAEAAAEEAAPTGLAALDAAALIEIGGFAAIATSIAVEFVIAAKSITDIKHAAAAGERAIEGYTAGALVALGCSPRGKGDPVYYARGAADYAAKAVEVVNNILTNPQLAQYKFTADEVIAAFHAHCVAHQAELAAKILATAKPAIARAFATALYEAEKDPWYAMESDARRSAQAVAVRLGVPDMKFGKQAEQDD